MLHVSQLAAKPPVTEEELHLIENIQTPYNFTNNDILAKLLLKNTYIREYQRMVCLGNTLLNYIITQFIFHQQTDLTPAKISSLRAEVSKKQTLNLRKSF